MKYQMYKTKPRTKGKRKQWRWRLRADNGKIISHGESYNNEADCRRAISLNRNSATADFEVIE